MSETLRPKLRGDGIPTRADQRYWTEAEWAIHLAIQAVERLGASMKLTDAVIALAEAKNFVADHAEGIQ